MTALFIGGYYFFHVIIYFRYMSGFVFFVTFMSELVLRPDSFVMSVWFLLYLATIVGSTTGYFAMTLPKIGNYKLFEFEFKVSFQWGYGWESFSPFYLIMEFCINSKQIHLNCYSILLSWYWVWLEDYYLVASGKKWLYFRHRLLELIYS